MRHGLMHCQLPDESDSYGYTVIAKDDPVVVEGPGLPVRRVVPGEQVFFAPRPYWQPLRWICDRLGIRSYRWAESRPPKNC